MRIASWNVNSLNARLPRVEEWLTLMEPDVLCMQETKLANDAFPALTFEAMGYESVHHGEGRWNGVAILSRVGLDDVAVDFADGGGPDSDARIVWATCGGVRVASCYIPNGRAVDDDHYQYKLAWLARLRAHLDQSCSPADPVALLGDFNIAPEDRDVWDIAKFEGATHVTPPERAAFGELLDWGLHDVFREQYPDDDGLFTYWDYTAGRFHKREGMRIDFVLASTPLAEATEWALVDRNARKGEKPSDHAPLMAQFAR
ncbi:MAG: exodeoxyribonuclease III [Acidimicrobiales bacterium]